ncbi:MAG: hypothetical protein HQM04_18560 [Magnetococcales bacterium]|nr:hypothetical protein [Magnetococcales bacterium]
MFPIIIINNKYLKYFSVFVIFLIFILMYLNWKYYQKHILITQQEYGEKWPFTVSRGVLTCTNNMLILEKDLWGSLFRNKDEINIAGYAINGKARSEVRSSLEWNSTHAEKYPVIFADLTEIWRDNPSIRGSKIPIPQDIFEKGLAVCNK